MNLQLHIDAAGRSAALHLAGDLDYGSTRAVVEAASRVVDERPQLRALRLGLAGLAFCDSAGLSGLVEIHRRTSVAGVWLHLDDRPGHLDRMLDITGLLDYLIAQPVGPLTRRLRRPDETGLG